MQCLQDTWSPVEEAIPQWLSFQFLVLPSLQIEPWNLLATLGNRWFAIAAEPRVLRILP
jgi:hypothetical protein